MEEKILKLFKGHPEAFLSGEDISQSLKISRSALWKYIEKLRTIGYEFDAVPHLGYKLREIPDKLYPFEIRCGLKTSFLGMDVVHYESINSTNTAAYDLAKKGAKEGTIVIAEGQTKGRGRLSREWISPKQKGIYISIILRPKITPFQAPRITLLASIAVSEAIRQIVYCRALIKWPNDILIKDKKIGGILTEMDAEQDSVNFIIIGIGINVNTSLVELPKGTSSILEETGTTVSRIELVKTILERFEHNYILLKKEGFSPIMKEWCRLSATLGRRVRATCMHKRIEGEAISIDSDGALILRLDNGFQERVLAGDIIFLR